MKRPAKKQLIRLIIAAAALAAVLGGAYWLVLWRRDRGIDARLDEHSAIIWKHAQANSLPTGLVRDVIRAESGGDEQAVSAKNARGLMQITPVALEEVRRQRPIGPGDLFDPDYNVQIGTAYLRILLNKFEGDVYMAVAAYNMGPTRLLQARRENPDMTAREIVAKIAPPQTRHYCRKIMGDKDLRLPTTE